MKAVYTAILSIAFWAPALSGWAGEPSRSPSLADVPEKGLYYGFVINNSSKLTEVEIWSVEEKRLVYKNIVLPPREKSPGEGWAHGEMQQGSLEAYRPPNMYALWLKLGTYRLSIRHRTVLMDNALTGTWKRFVVVLDEDYVCHSPGPFTFEIEDD
jgi:hypothetical protein